jgi:hypothetical protein
MTVKVSDIVPGDFIAWNTTSPSELIIAIYACEPGAVHNYNEYFVIESLLNSGKMRKGYVNKSWSIITLIRSEQK